MTMGIEVFAAAGIGAVLGFAFGQISVKYPSSEDIFARLVDERAEKLTRDLSGKEVAAEIENAALVKTRGIAS